MRNGLQAFGGTNEAITAEIGRKLLRQGPGFFEGAIDKNETFAAFQSTLDGNRAAGAASRLSQVGPPVLNAGERVLIGSGS